MDASLNTLRDNDIEVWQNFVWLGVLPDDATVAAPMAATLWDIAEADAVNRLERLWRSGLLLSSSPVQIGSQTWPAYHLTQRLHTVACRLLTKQMSGLGIPLSQAHAELLQRYQAHTHSGLWHTLADDGYIHTHLAWHLMQAGLKDEIHKLLRGERLGRNGWYEVCDRLQKTDTFAANVMLAWQLAEALFEADPSRSVALQCRYALMAATLSTLKVRSPGRSLGSLPLEQDDAELACTLQSSDARIRASLLTEISDYLPRSLKEDVLTKALAATETIQPDSDRLQALQVLVPKLSPCLLPKALVIIRAVRTGANREVGCDRARALVVLAAQLPEAVPEVFAAIRDIQSEYTRATTLKDLAPHLPPELLFEAFAIAQDLRFEEVRFEGDRITAMIVLSSAMSKLKINELSLLWSQILRSLLSQSRQDFLLTVLALSKVTYTLGGQAAVVEVLIAMKDIARWWPRKRQRNEY